MADASRPTRRRRLSVDLPPDAETATRAIADRYFRGVTTDAIRSSLSFLSWAIDAKRHGRRVVSVAVDYLPTQYEEPVLPGIEEQLATDWVWLVPRRHPWRRQLWLKGRRITAGDLARTLEIEGWTPERASAEFDLPLEAVLEAQRYAASSRDLILAEERENAIAAREDGT